MLAHCSNSCSWGLLVLQGLWRMVKGSGMGLWDPEENQGAAEMPLTPAGT